MICASAALIGLALGSPAQTVPAVSTQAAPSPAPPPLRLLEPGEIPRFEDSFPSRKGLLLAARRSLKYLAGQPSRAVRLGGREYGPGQLAATLEALIALIEGGAEGAALDQALRDGFDVFQSIGMDGQGKVVFSSYYQPVLEASLKRSETYRFPIYGRPPDMVEADLSAFDKKYEGAVLIGRVDKDGRLVPYHSRDRIDSHRALAGQGLELAWLKEKFDVLDLHIQGSGILRFPSGRTRLARFAGTNAHPYNSVGLALVKAGVFTREDISHEKLRAYFREHPEAQDWAMSQNPRYTFFKLEPLPPDGEPYGTIQERLVAARSFAVDPSVVPLGALAFYTVTSPQADGEGRLLGFTPTSRLAVAMDTGGAIKGPGRVDIYAGHGPQAATVARGQWHEGRLYILVRKLPPRDR